MAKPPGCNIERKVVAAIVAWLVVRPADRLATEMAQQQRPDPTVRDDDNIATAASRGSEHMIDSGHDAALSIDGALPAAHASLRLSKELIRHGLELGRGQVA